MFSSSYIMASLAARTSRGMTRHHPRLLRSYANQEELARARLTGPAPVFSTHGPNESWNEARRNSIRKPVVFTGVIISFSLGCYLGAKFMQGYLGQHQAEQPEQALPEMPMPKVVAEDPFKLEMERRLMVKRSRPWWVLEEAGYLDPSEWDGRFMVEAKPDGPREIYEVRITYKGSDIYSGFVFRDEQGMPALRLDFFRGVNNNFPKIPPTIDYVDLLREDGTLIQRIEPKGANLVLFTPLEGDDKRLVLYKDENGNPLHDRNGKP